MYALLMIPSPPQNRQPTEACARLGFKPTITFIVVTKKHKVVFFPRSDSDRDQSGNCPPGTVIDSDVVSPVEADYYLYGHAGLRGTSKPAHYNVLHDDHNFTCVVSPYLFQLLSNNAGECFFLCLALLFCNRTVACVAFTDPMASNTFHMPFVTCMLGAPVLSRSQLRYTVSSHSPRFCQAPPSFTHV
jgi:hypothetical protein